jgi:small-conductance mechanosensitive channel
MPRADLSISLAASFWDKHGDEVSAGITVVIAFAVATLVDRLLRGKASGRLGAEGETRLRLVRRLVFVLILGIGITLALAQFDAIKRTATGILASSAVLGLVIGFAARQTLANAVAGILLAITQPIRIGDLVTFEGHTGTVEDIRLTYTFIRKGDGARIVVPNERLAQNTIENHTIVDPHLKVEVDLYVRSDADPYRALEAVVEVPEVESAEIAAVEAEAVRISATAWASGVAERGELAARIRASALERLRTEGLLSTR